MQRWSFEAGKRRGVALGVLAGAFLGLGCAGGSLAEAPKADQQKAAVLAVADAYLKVYQVFDLEKMEPFYSEDAIFYDPTSEMWGEDGFHWRGKKEIMEGMRKLVAEFNPKMEYIVKERYESAGHVVYSGKGRAVAVEDGATRISCNAVTTVITVKAGKVVEHRDYADYATYLSMDWRARLSMRN